MADASDARLSHARKLMDEFALRSGLSDGSAPTNRYLWTDAFAVQTYFGLAQVLPEPTYHQLALRLIEQVHTTLGQYHPDDAKTGWLSGLPEAQARQHPTAAGLRIGKQQLERKPIEPYDERLEWDRDGQYFHYLIPWAHALLLAAKSTGNEQYIRWAAELLVAGEKFVDRTGGRLKMYWKMSVDLTRPLVPSMGAHDPLTGFICAERVKQAAPRLAAPLASLRESLRLLCTGRHWATSDSLGVGGLLLDALRASEALQREEWPDSLQPERLLENALESLEEFRHLHSRTLAPHYRLAFRECGLSLGLRALLGAKHSLAVQALPQRRLDEYFSLADEIEHFWLEPRNQQAPTWTDHLNINAVTLAASLVAKQCPQAFAPG